MALSKYHANKAEEWNFEDIVKEYCPSKDGYELMRDLERHCFWEGSQALMEDLGEINFSVHRTIKSAQIALFSLTLKMLRDWSLAEYPLLLGS